MSRVLIFGLCLAVLLVPTSAFAQDAGDGAADGTADGSANDGAATDGTAGGDAPFVLTDRQMELNTEGFQAAINGELEKAERLYRSSLNEGEANITYLNLGRALAGLGRCDDALEAYRAVTTAPQVQSPTPAEVAEILARFEGELPTQCPGKLQFVCSPLTMRVQIGDDAPQVCPANPIEVPPGSHTVLGILDDQETAATVEVVGFETTTVELTIVPKQDEIVTPVTPVPVDEGISGLGIAGWTMLGVGAAAVGGGFVMGGVVVAPDLDDYRAAADAGDQATYDDLQGTIQTNQIVMWSLWVGGGTIAATGLALALYDLLATDGSEAAPEEDTLTLAPWLSSTGSGASLGLKW